MSEYLHLTTDHQLLAIKTWRYLRLALVALVLGLIASFLYEHSVSHVNPVSHDRPTVHCWQRSLSAYYYTPVHGYFISALVAMGVCMFCLKGSSPAEDVLLDIGGLCAVVVGLVPTPNPGHCASVLGTITDRNFNIGNNVRALLAVGVCALVASAVLWRKKNEKDSFKGFLALAAVAVVAIGIFTADIDLFRRGAHGVAAGLLFVCVTAVVFVNGWNRVAEEGSGLRRRLAAVRRDRYGVIGYVMVASATVVGISAVAGFEYWALVGELSLILLFAVFWLTQTVDLWNEGLR